MTAAPTLAAQFVPVTPAVAALLHQLRQEAIEASAAPDPGSVVLAPTGVWKCSGADDTSLYGYSDDYSARLYLFRQRTQPGGVWTGEESRHDDQGRRWARRIEAVTDDFGALVEVAP